VTTLLIDALIALVKLVDRGMSVVEKNVRLRADCPVVDAHPAGVGRGSAASANPGGDPTSELLTDAAVEIQNLGRMAYSTPQPWIDGFAAELRDRAAQFRAAND
jgi:hypothetical protein